MTDCRRSSSRGCYRSILIAVVGFLVVGASWASWLSYRAQNQRRIVAMVKELGGATSFENELDYKYDSPEIGKSIRKSLADSFGIESVAHLDDVRLGAIPDDKSPIAATRAADEHVARLRGLPRLKTLWLAETRVTDAGCKSLSSIGSLTSLDLHGTDVTDNGVSHFRRLPRLRRLYLNDCEITNEGLSHLVGLSELELIQLDRTRVGDAGIQHLEKMRNLTYLYMRETRISDGAFQSIATLPLKELMLADTSVTDNGLEALRNHRTLEYLDLDRTRIGNEGVQTLPTLSSLRVVLMRGTRITDECVDDLLKCVRLRALAISSGSLEASSVDRIRTTLSGCQVHVD